MPYGIRPTCKICGKIEPDESQETCGVWTKKCELNGQVTVMCFSCASNDGKQVMIDGNIKEEAEVTAVKIEDSKDNIPLKETTQIKTEEKSKPSSKPTMVALRKSARCKAKVKTNTQSKVNTVKGKSRRIIFKRNVLRAPTSFATPITSNSIFMKGMYYQTGDIVSMVDIDDGQTYYAQINGFLQDQYCEKSATVTWLLPTQDSLPNIFDPATYYLGPEEEIPRKLECMQFVCHAPSDYFKNKTSPYPTLPDKIDKGFIWTRLGPKIVAKDELTLSNE